MTLKEIGIRIFDDLSVPPENRRHVLFFESPPSVSSNRHPRQDGVPHSPFQFSKPSPPTPSRVTVSRDSGIGFFHLEGQERQVQGIQLVCRGGSGYRNTSAGEDYRCVPLLMPICYPRTFARICVDTPWKMYFVVTTRAVARAESLEQAAELRLPPVNIRHQYGLQFISKTDRSKLSSATFQNPATLICPHRGWLRYRSDDRAHPWAQLRRPCNLPPAHSNRQPSLLPLECKNPCGIPLWMGISSTQRSLHSPGALVNPGG